MPDHIFLMSSERSGSNLIRVIFDSHRNICAPPSPQLLYFFFPLLSNYGALEVDRNFGRLADDVLAVVARAFVDWETKITKEEILAGCVSRTFSSLIDAVYDVETKAHGKRRAFIKDNGNIEYVLHIAHAFPRSKFVYLVRDGRDTTVSWLKSPAHVGGVKESARVWSEEQAKGSLAYSLLLETGRVRLLHYEDLVNDPERVLRPICEFLGEEFDQAMLEFHAGRQAKKSAESLKDWKNLSSPMISDNYRKYLNGLSARQLHAVERIAGRELMLFGYSLEHKLRQPRNLLQQMRRVKTLGTGFFKLLAGGTGNKEEIQRRMTRIKILKKIRTESEMAPRSWSAPSVLDKSD